MSDITGGAPAVDTPHGTGPHEHAPRPLFEGPLELLEGCGGIDECDVRGGEDPLPVGEAPVLREPAVEGPERRHAGFRILLERGLHADAQGGQHDAGVHSLVVHHRQAGIAVAVLGVLLYRCQLPERRPEVIRAGPGTEEVRQCPGGRQVGERGVRYEPVDGAGHEQATLAVDVGPLDRPFRHLGLQVAGERVGRLVVVVVGIHDPEVEHGQSPCRWPVMTTRTRL